MFFFLEKQLARVIIVLFLWMSFYGFPQVFFLPSSSTYQGKHCFFHVSSAMAAYEKP